MTRILNIASLIIYIVVVAPREDTADRVFLPLPRLSTSVIPYCCRLLYPPAPTGHG